MTEIERIARQLCTDAGFDPDARAIHFRNAANGPNGCMLVPEVATFAAWTTYAPMVQRVIDLMFTTDRTGNGFDLKEKMVQP